MERKRLQLKDFSNVCDTILAYEIRCEPILPQDSLRNMYEHLHEKGYIKDGRRDFFKWVKDQGIEILEETYLVSQFMPNLAKIPLENEHDFFLMMKLIVYFQKKTKTCYNFAEYLVGKAEYFQFECSLQPVESFLKSCQRLSKEYPPDIIGKGRDMDAVENWRLQFEILTTTICKYCGGSGLWIVVPLGV